MSEKDRVRARYFAWLAKHPHLAEDPAEVWFAAWQAGSWDTLQQNTTLGLNLTQIIQRLEELAALYADVDHDREFEAELEAASAYWKGEP